MLKAVNNVRTVVVTKVFLRIVSKGIIILLPLHTISKVAFFLILEVYINSNKGYTKGEKNENTIQYQGASTELLVRVYQCWLLCRLTVSVFDY